MGTWLSSELGKVQAVREKEVVPHLGYTVGSLAAYSLSSPHSQYGVWEQPLPKYQGIA